MNTINFWMQYLLNRVNSIDHAMGIAKHVIKTVEHTQYSGFVLWTTKDRDGKEMISEKLKKVAWVLLQSGEVITNTFKARWRFCLSMLRYHSENQRVRHVEQFGVIAILIYLPFGQYHVYMSTHYLSTNNEGKVGWEKQWRFLKQSTARSKNCILEKKG